MTLDWPTTVVGFLRAHGLPEAYSEPDGALWCLPGVRGLAMALGSPQSAYADLELLASALDGAEGFAVVQPRPGGSPVGSAFVTLSLTAFTRLLTGEPVSAPPHQERMTYAEFKQDTDGLLPLLATAVGALANAAAGSPLSLDAVVEGADPVAVVGVLAVLALSALRNLLPQEQVAAVLARLGLIAAGGDVR